MALVDVFNSVRHELHELTKARVLTCRSRPAKHLGKMVEVIKKEREHLVNVRDQVSKEINKALVQGKVPPIKLHNWVKEAKEIERRVNDIILSKENTESSSLEVKELMNMLEKITDHLKKSPFKHGLVYDGPVSTLGKEILHSTKYKAWISPDRHKRAVESGKGAQSTTKQRSEKSFPVTESSLLPDPIPATTSETEVEILPVKEMGFQTVSYESEGRPLIPAGENLETLPSETKGLQSSHEIEEVEISPSEPAREAHLAPDFSKKSLETMETLPSETEGLQSSREIEEVESSPPEAAREAHMAPDFSKGSLETMDTLPSETEVLQSSHETEEIGSSPSEAAREAHMAPDFSKGSLETMETLPSEIEGLQSSHEIEEIEPSPSEAARKAHMAPDFSKGSLETRETIPSETEGLQSTHEIEEVESSPSEAAAREAHIAPDFSKGSLETMETLPSETEGLQSTHEIEEEVEISPSEAEREVHMAPDFRKVSLETTMLATTSKPSIDRTVKNILGVMKETTARTIGIYGMSGIGKTTVLQALYNHPETKSMFDLIIWVPVSIYFSRRKIQNKVAKQLSLCPRNSEPDDQVATEILQSLKRKKFLLLLDDVSEKIDLAAVGIPNSTQEEGCRIILTTRYFHISEFMIDWVIEVEFLSMEEAWELFQEQVGGVLDSQEFRSIAHEIVQKCRGLPLTIIATGRALRHENNVLVWKHALRQFWDFSQLETPPEAPLRLLEFSYDSLKDRDVKRCFLHCALMFAQDHEIKVDDLIENFIEEDLIHGSSSRARKKGQDIIKNLIDSSLLESVHGGLSLRMHGMFKDLGLWIMTSKEEPYQVSITEDVILPVAGAGLTEPPLKELWEGKKMIFLMKNDFSWLPEKPNCHNLLTLFVQKNRLLRSIPDSFFIDMPSLRVLNLSKTGIRSLPPSLFGFTKLRALILCHCNCLDKLPREVGSLGALEELDLEGTELYNLPDEIDKLGFLEHLQISFYEAIDTREYDKLPTLLVSSGIISKLVALKELHIVVHRGDQRWNDSANAIALDVGILNNLTSLQLYFPNVDDLNNFITESQPWIRNSISKFKFIAGQIIKRIISRVPDDIEFDYDQQDRCLRFVNSENKPDAVLEVLRRATAFYLDHHHTIQSLSEFGITNMKELKFCILSESPNILAVIDSEENRGSALQYLEHLSIHYLWNLENICKGPLPHGSFSALIFLSVHTCPKLEILVEESMLQCLSNLEELVVEDCASLQKITEMEEKTENDDFVILPSLRKLSLLYLPQLVSIWKGFGSLRKVITSKRHCPKLEIEAQRSAHDAFEL